MLCCVALSLGVCLGKEQNEALYHAISDYALTVSNQPTIGLHFAARHMRGRVADVLSSTMRSLGERGDALSAATAEARFATEFLKE